MKKENWALVLAAALAACGKSEPPAAAPELAAPEGAFSSAGKASRRPLSAEAEVKASSGPVELTLRIHKTRIKPEETFWFQLRIRNVGGRKILVHDQVFEDPDQLNDNFRMRWGIYLEATGPDGIPLEEAIRLEHAPPVQGVSGLLEVDGPKEEAMVAGWRKQGLSLYDVNLKLIEFNIKKKRAEENKRGRPLIHLEPGESAETKSSFNYRSYDRLIKKRPPPRPVGEFSRLELFDIEKPGKYKIRAVYDYVMGKEYERKYKRNGRRMPPENVLVRSPWIQVEVLP